MPESVFNIPESLFNFRRNPRSPSSGIGVQDQPKYARFVAGRAEPDGSAPLGCSVAAVPCQPLAECVVVSPPAHICRTVLADRAGKWATIGTRWRPGSRTRTRTAVAAPRRRRAAREGRRPGVARRRGRPRPAPQGVREQVEIAKIHAGSAARVANRKLEKVEAERDQVTQTLVSAARPFAAWIVASAAAEPPLSAARSATNPRR